MHTCPHHRYVSAQIACHMTVYPLPLVHLLAGAMPAKFNVHWGASYGRLVSHLQRLWDYDSCDEARLKVWLAHHLLARENTGEASYECGMPSRVIYIGWYAGWRFLRRLPSSCTSQHATL